MAKEVDPSGQRVSERTSVQEASIPPRTIANICSNEGVGRRPTGNTKDSQILFFLPIRKSDTLSMAGPRAAC